MVSAVTASTASAETLTAPQQPAGLDAALAKSEGQLADWVCCPSGKTPAGKAKIEEIRDRIGAIKTQMQKAEQATREAAAPAPARLGAVLGNALDAFA